MQEKHAELAQSRSYETTMTEVTLVPPVSEGRESYRIRVTVDGAKVFDAPRKSLREGGAARRNSLLEQM